LALETPAPLLALGVSKPVFDCRWPLTRERTEALWASRPHALYDAPYLGAQDDLHETTTLQWRAWVAPVVAIPDALGFHYATQGSTEAIRESLALHAIASRAAGRQPVIHVFHGEYEGYAAEMEGYGGRVVRHDRDDYEESLAREASAGDRIYLCQPAAIDGNVWAGYDAFVAFCEARLPEVRVVVDLTYVGAVAREYRVVVDSPVIDVVVASLSKVMGIYYHRVGFAFSRLPLAGLYGNRWFKNTFSLALASDLMTRTGHPYALPRRHQPVQEEVVRELARRTGLPVDASDAVMLATSPATGPAVTDALRTLARGAPGRERLRLCLTPALDAHFAR
jgi:histidinol-phosphate/aromatic aminotransferase/cobyric acid decarboxylase-like protein